MKHIKKTSLLLLVFLFFFHTVSTPVFALAAENTEKTSEELTLDTAIVITDEEEQLATIYDDESLTIESFSVEQGERVIVIEKMPEVSLVEYENKIDESFGRGYILNTQLEFEGLPETTETNETDDGLSEEINTDDITQGNNGDSVSEDITSEDNSLEIDKNEDILAEENLKEGTESEDILTEVEAVEEETTEESNSNSSNTKSSMQTFSTNASNASSLTYSGIALNSTTIVYEDTDLNSKNLKSYSAGSILKYRSFSGNWYIATVYVNGKYLTGYIHKTHVENIDQNNQESLKGIGLKSPTPVYDKASTSAKQLKSYAEGSLLIYKTFSDNWYEATVYIQGKAKTGYIHKSHVENVHTSQQENLKGIALGSPTTVYAKASTNSKKLKSYGKGSILVYKTFSNEWYEATVYINGKPTTGYIHRSHVENVLTSNQESLKGIGLANPTAVYTSASTTSKKLKSYAEGTILIYRTFSSEWYEATVYVNGKRTTGYIFNKDVEGLYDKNEVVYGVSLKAMSVYSKASKKASVLRSYPKTHHLKFKTFSPNWYEATVILNGKPTVGYIHRSDVSTDKVISNTTSYNTAFNKVVDIQMSRNPKADGAGKVSASRSQVEYYVNSSNFNKNSDAYYQFLVLSEPAGLNAAEVNKNVLNNHGILTGTAQSFIDAGRKFNLNEAYLISHALLETGNGSSTLARGVPVDNKGKVVSEKDKVYTVYNMYGIGAIDSNPLNGGAKKAFDEGWFTPKDAIIGGAQFINTYIDRGQDTLYKMRWNPISPGHPQYATDVGWAVKQTANISKIYNLLDNYVLIYDIPKYAGQPASSGDPNKGITVPDAVINYPTGIFGVNTNNLNIRNEPGTQGALIATIPQGTKIEILGTNGSWYKAKYNGKIGWISGDYVNLLNLLEVTVNSLAIRPTPDTTQQEYGRANAGKLLAGKINNNNEQIMNGEWYQVTFEGKIAWISGGKNGTEYINFK